MKMQPEEELTKYNSKMNNNLKVSFQFLQEINTKSLARHGIWNTTQGKM